MSTQNHTTLQVHTETMYQQQLPTLSHTRCSGGYVLKKRSMSCTDLQYIPKVLYCGRLQSPSNSNMSKISLCRTNASDIGDGSRWSLAHADDYDTVYGPAASRGGAHQAISSDRVDYGEYFTSPDSAYNVSQDDIDKYYNYKLTSHTDDTRSVSWMFGIDGFLPPGYHNPVYTTKGYSGGYSINDYVLQYCIQITRDDNSPHWNWFYNKVLDANGRVNTINPTTSQKQVISICMDCCLGNVTSEDVDTIAMCGRIFGGSTPQICSTQTKQCLNVMRAYCQIESEYDNACADMRLWNDLSPADMKEICAKKDSRWWNICGCFYPDVEFESTTGALTKSTGIFKDYSEQLNKLSSTYEMSRAQVRQIMNDPSCYYRPCTSSDTFNLVTSQNNCQATGITFVSCTQEADLDIGSVNDNGSVTVNNTCNVQINGTTTAFVKNGTPPTNPSPTNPSPTIPSPYVDPVSRTDFTTPIILLVIAVVVTISVTAGVVIYVNRKKEKINQM